MKKCSRCKEEKQYTEFGWKPSAKTPDGYTSACKSCDNKRQKELRELRRSNGLCYHCTQPRDNDTVCCNKCRDGQKRTRLKFKLEVFEAYGGAICKCCQETEIKFLSLDHINNNGAEHKRELATSGNNRTISGEQIYRWARQNNYPAGLQVLCMNCNFAKGKYGTCPHQK